jgi:hypothetical protein
MIFPTHMMASQNSHIFFKRPIVDIEFDIHGLVHINILVEYNYTTI